MFERHDIVQITDASHPWYSCLVVVSEVKSWGIQGWITIPTNDDKPNGQAFIRLPKGMIEKVGVAVIIDASEEEKNQS